MDMIVLFSIAAGLLILILIIAALKQRNSNTEKSVQPQAQARGPQGQNRPVQRRVVGGRNTRARLSAAVRHENESDNDEESLQDADDDIEMPDGKLGAKKRAKLEAKAERQKMRETEERNREEKKKREKLENEEKDKITEKEKLQELKRLEDEKKALEEKERQEHEEYLKMKEMFSVEEEGCEVVAEDEEKNLLQEFVSYIKTMKVVVLEDLAAHFKLKTQQAISRIQDLQAEGSLTGVLDDRGKFIFISQQELEDVAKFVKQRGRVSISDLAESSNQLINLKSSINTATA